MMGTFYYILLQGSLFFAIYLLLHELFFKKIVAFKWHRFFLIVMPIISYVSPTVLSFSNYSISTPSENISTINLAPILISENEGAFASSSTFDMESYILLIVFIGTLLILFSGMITAIRTFKAIPSNHVYIHEGFYIHESSVHSEAWTYFNHIIIPKNFTAIQKDMILEHELTHARQKHTLDLLYAEIIKALLWWNPLIYLWIKNIKENHEYLADEKVLQSFDKKSYGYLLLSNALQTKQYKFSNTFFNVSILNRRIKMMKKQSKFQKVIPALGVVILSGAFMAFSSQQTMLSSHNETNTNIVKHDSIYDKVDVMPEYPGGNKALFEFVGKKLKYPKKAQKKGIEGKALVSFIIDQDGNVIDATVVKSDNDIFNQPSVDVVNAMPKWKPGEKDGEKVKVKMILPFQYKLPKEE